MDLLVFADGVALWGREQFRCALGRGGLSRQKREGDGATPVGAFIMRRVLYRLDRLAAPATSLPLAPIAPSDGWCDDPADGLYNRPVAFPFRARAEALWRADELYDVVVPLGYNDDPVVPGRGSAIFLHVAQPDYTPTEGCVALTYSDLLRVLATAAVGAHVIVRDRAAPAP